MDEKPDQPRRQAAEMQGVQIRHRLVPADRGHASLIEIPKALRLSPSHHVQNIFGGVASLLHRHRRNPGKRLPRTFIGEIRQITDHLNFVMSRNR